MKPPIALWTSGLILFVWGWIVTNAEESGRAKSANILFGWLVFFLIIQLKEDHAKVPQSIIHYPQCQELTSTSCWLLSKLFFFFFAPELAVLWLISSRSQWTQSELFVFKKCACKKKCACFSSYLLNGTFPVLIELLLLVSRQCRGSNFASVVLGPSTWTRRRG